MLDTVIFGNGRLGSAIATGLRARGEPPPRLLGRPPGGAHAPLDVDGADVVYEASRGDAVGPNLAAALDAGCRRFVIATTGWDEARPAVDAELRAHGAAAVAAANFSLGVAVYLRLVDLGARLLSGLDEFDPFVLEWHRRAKLDRPSGTAAEIVRRLSRHRTGDGARRRPDIEVTSIRAGSAPGMHLVGFDAPGETLEVRLTARDRSAYVAGALAAADWLRREPREPGIHPFDTVVDELLVTA